MPDIVVKNLSCSYIDRNKSETVVFENFNVKFENGKVNVLLGPSGCGKTTLLKCICHQIEFDGHIYFDDLDIESKPINKLNVGYVNQDLRLYPHMTVFDNIAFPLKLQKFHPDDINYLVRMMAEKLQILPCLTRKPKEISLGQQQRVAIAKALIKMPKVCLFDEALTNLDKPLAREIRVLLKKALNELKCTAIYVTHDYEEAFTIADRLFVLNDSKIEVSGSPQEVYKSNNETISYLKKSTEIKRP